METNAGSLSETFEVLEKLGEGGMGKVFKVKGKIDQKLYAVKKIRIDLEKYEYNIIAREVRNLASLEHENIVAYFHAWQEESPDQSPDSESSVSDLSSSASGRQKIIASKSPQNLISSTDSPDIVFVEDIGFEEETVCLGGGDSNSDSEQSESEEENTLSIEFFSTAKTHTGQTSQKGEEVKRVIDAPSACRPNHELRLSTESIPYRFMDLHIKMEFCDSTLRKVIDEKLYEDKIRMWNLFRQILRAFEYIHSRKILHRDINPNNIFIRRLQLDSTSEIVKVGDFGLSRTHREEMTAQQIAHANKLEEATTADITGRIGTALYSAPEVLRSEQYGQPADMYSIGLVFFEMNSKPMKTESEKAYAFNGLRKAQEYPADFDKDNKQMQIKIINSLVSESPAKRLQAKELLHPSNGFLPPQPEEDRNFMEKLETVLQKPDSQRCKEVFDMVVKNTTACETSLDSLSHMTSLLDPEQDNEIRYRFEEVSKQHGAKYFDSPLMISVQPSNCPGQIPIKVLLSNRSTAFLTNSTIFAFSCNADRDRSHASSRALFRGFTDGIVCWNTQSDGIKGRRELSLVIETDSRKNHLVAAELLSILQQVFTNQSHMIGARLKLRIGHDDYEKCVFQYLNITEDEANHFVSRSALYKLLCQRHGKPIADIFTVGKTINRLQQCLEGNDEILKQVEAFEQVLTLSGKMGFEMDTFVHAILRPPMPSTAGLKFQLLLQLGNNTDVSLAFGGMFGPVICGGKPFFAVTIDMNAVNKHLYQAKSISKSVDKIYVHVVILEPSSTDNTEEKAEFLGDIWKRGLSAICIPWTQAAKRSGILTKCVIDMSKSLVRTERYFFRLTEIKTVEYMLPQLLNDEYFLLSTYI